MTMIAEIRRWLSGVIELLLWLVAMLALLQVQFGDNFVEVFGLDLVANIGELIAKFGNAGLVGVVAAALIAYLIARNRSGSSGGV